MAVKPRIRSDKPKRVRKRKARTEVSSSSDTESSSGSSDSSEGEAEVLSRKPRVLVQNKVYQTESENDDGAQIIPVSGTVDSVVDRSLASDVKSAEIANAEEAFTSFYLRQMTTEFAEDLDKIRSAGDFNNRSIGMLVNALKQSNSCFANDERINIGRSIIVKNA